MGWTPTKTAGGAGKADDGPPTPPRRRRKRAPEPATPLVDAAAARSPRLSTGTRPRGGVTDGAQEAKLGEDDRYRARVRLGKRWTEIVTAVKSGEYTWAEFVEGLDEGELARGQLRDMNGGFSGRPPSLVPREFLLAAGREQKRRFEEIFGSEVIGIATEYVKLAKDSTIPAKDRAKMMQYAMERIFGGIPKEIKVSQEQPWEQMVVNVTSEEGAPMAPHLARRYAGYQERAGGGVTEDPE